MNKSVENGVLKVAVLYFSTEDKTANQEVECGFILAFLFVCPLLFDRCFAAEDFTAVCLLNIEVDNRRGVVWEGYTVLLAFLPFCFRSRGEELGALGEQCLVHFVFHSFFSHSEYRDSALEAVQMSVWAESCSNKAIPSPVRRRGTRVFEHRYRYKSIMKSG